MAASIELLSSKMQIRTKVGTLDGGRDKVKSVTLTGIDQSAEAQTLLDVSGAIGGVIAAPVIDVRRIDENLVSDAG